MDQAVARMQIETIRALTKGWDLDIKFKNIVSAPWAEPLVLCGLIPEKDISSYKVRNGRAYAYNCSPQV